MTISGAPSENIFRAIDRLASGDEGYACFAGHLVGLVGLDDPRPAVMAESLLNETMRETIEARFAERFASFDNRAALSIWMKWYLNAFLPPLLLADLLLMRALPVSLDQVAFIVDENARVIAVRMDGLDEDTGNAGAFDRFEHLIFDHFEPLIEIWAERSGVTRRVLWSNVGNTFEAMLRRVETVSGPSPRLQQAEQLLHEPRWPDGRVNPLHGAVHYVVDADTFIRRRRICCIQYLLPDRRFCKACPVEEARISLANTVGP